MGKNRDSFGTIKVTYCCFRQYWHFFNEKPHFTQSKCQKRSHSNHLVVGSCVRTFDSYLVFTWLYVETAQRIVLLHCSLSKIQFVVDLSYGFPERKKMLSLLGLWTGIRNVLQNRIVLNWSKTKYMDVSKMKYAWKYVFKRLIMFSTNIR